MDPDRVHQLVRLDKLGSVYTVYTHDNRHCQSLQIREFPGRSSAEGFQALFKDRKTGQDTGRILRQGPNRTCSPNEGIRRASWKLSGFPRDPLQPCD